MRSRNRVAARSRRHGQGGGGPSLRKADCAQPQGSLRAAGLRGGALVSPAIATRVDTLLAPSPSQVQAGNRCTRGSCFASTPRSRAAALLALAERSDALGLWCAHTAELAAESQTPTSWDHCEGSQWGEAGTLRSCSVDEYAGIARPLERRLRTMMRERREISYESICRVHRTWPLVCTVSITPVRQSGIFGDVKGVVVASI